MGGDEIKQSMKDRCDWKRRLKTFKQLTSLGLGKMTELNTQR